MLDKYTDPYLIEDAIVKRIIITFGEILITNNEVSSVSYSAFDYLDEVNPTDEIKGSYYSIDGEYHPDNKSISLSVDTRTGEYAATVVTCNLYERNELPKLESECRHILRLMGSQLTTEEITQSIQQMAIPANFRERMSTTLPPISEIPAEEIRDTLYRILKEHIPMFGTTPIPT